MSGEEERILDLALEEVVGGREPPDLADRILATARQLRHVHRYRTWLPLATAAAVVLGVGLWLLFGHEPEQPVAPRPLTAEERARVDCWLDLQMESLGKIDPTNPGDLERVKEVWQARQDLVAFLADRPVAWGYVRPRVLTRLKEASERSVKRQLLEILARGPGAAQDPAIFAALEDELDVFDPELLTCLAERGVEPAREALADLLADGEPNPVLVPAAAFFALRGDPRGKDTLEWFEEQAFPSGVLPFSEQVCAVALHRLGTPRPWVELVDRARDDVEASLRAGDLEAARRRVLELDYFHRAIATRKPIAVTYVAFRLNRYEAARAVALDTADKIRARLDLLAR
jgi:hypothetical protein